jgi:hypothetical protein
MQLSDVIAESFTSALAEDHPSNDIERLFGIEAGTMTGQLMLGTWMTLFKHDGSVTTAVVSKGLRTDTIPEAFQKWVDRSAGSGYMDELKARGLNNISWLRMVEFKFGCT